MGVLSAVGSWIKFGVLGGTGGRSFTKLLCYSFEGQLFMLLAWAATGVLWRD
jgi:hypothetical protein